MSEKQVRAMMVAKLKYEARNQNLAGDWTKLAATIKELDRVWKNDKAAAAFYTELELAAR